MRKKTTTQFLKNSVNKLDKINNIEFDLDGNLKQILNDPVKWGEEQVGRAIDENIDKYLQSKKLGKEFWDEIKNIN